MLTVKFAGTFANTGALVSIVVTETIAVLTFPQLSVAVHVILITFSFSHFPGVMTSFLIKTTFGSHSSETVTFNNGILSQSTVISAGIFVIKGALKSPKTTFCVAIELLPQLSIAVQVRWIVIEFGQLPGMVSICVRI